MLETLLRFSLTQRIFVAVVVVVLAILGASAWKSIPIDAFPEISPTQVKLILKAPGMTAEEIERRVTVPIETELLGIPRQEMLRSMTKYAITDITLDFEEGTDIYWARQQVAERLATVREQLPSTVSGGLAPMSTALSEMYMFTLENPDLTLLEKRDILDWEIRPLLRTVPGVADVNILGGEARSYFIRPDFALMAELDLSLDDIRTAVSDTLQPIGAGRINQGNDVLTVRAETPLAKGADLENVVVARSPDEVYRLGDVAMISVGHLARYGAVTRDGVEAAQALVIALRGSNTGEVAAGVSAKLEEIVPSLPQGSEINVFYDRSRLIDTAVGTLSTALVQSVVLVIALLALFLGNLRAAFIVSLSLPLAALMTFLLMSLAGVTANLMSLGGLVIAIGMIVDSSVVVTENVLTRLNRQSRLPVLHEVYRASSEVALPVVSGTLVIIIVFSPLLTLQGLEGKLFSPVALTIVFAMISALLIAITIVPVLSSVLLKKTRTSTPGFVEVLQKRYVGSLNWILANPVPLLVGIALVLFCSTTFFVLTGKTFMPVMDEGDIIVQLEKSPTITLEASIALDKQIEAALLSAVPEIRQIVARTGSDELGLDPMSLNETDIFMELEPTDEWREGGKPAIEEAIREVLARFPGINFGLTQPIQMRTAEMLTGSSGDVAVRIFGSDLGVIASLTDEAVNRISKIDGAVDVSATVSEGGKYLAVEPKPEIAAVMGLNTTALGDLLKTQLEGLSIGEIVEGRRRISVQIGGGGRHSSAPTSIPALERRVLLLPDGTSATLGDVASVAYAEGPVLIEREQGNRFGLVSLKVGDRDVVSVVEDIREALEHGDFLPPGYTLSYGGDFENQRRASRTLLLVVPLALGLIALILFATLGSISRAVLIIANLPFALMGGVIALYLAGEYLSVPASVGLIALLGISVLNGVVMLGHMDQQIRANRSLEGLVVGAARDRLRPVLMTATTAMIGLFPLVFASGPGAEIQRPLAIVVIGGLVTATVTTLYLLPVVYHRLEARHGS